jgi:hypothetical protein
MRFNDELRKAGVLIDAIGLHSIARGKKVRISGDQRTVIDGPFTEIEELIGGY